MSIYGHLSTTIGVNMVTEHDLSTLPTKYYNNDKLTPFYWYRLYSVGKSYFRDLIIQLDTSHVYTRESTREIIDEEATEKLKGKYANRLVMLREKWNEYRNSHLGEFDTVSVTDSVDDFTIMKSNFHPTANFSLKDAVIGYAICSEKLKDFEKDELPKYTKSVSKTEFKTKHDNIRAMLREELMIPSESDLTVRVVVTKTEMKRFNKDTKPNTDDDTVIEILSDRFLEYLVEN